MSGALAIVRPEHDARPAVQTPIYSVDEMEKMANKLAKSRLMPGIDTPDAAFTLMMICQSEGLHPIQALKRYHIIEGRPSMRADAMQAEFQRRGGVVRWIKTTPEECEAAFSHPVGQPDPVVLRVTLKQLIDSGVAMQWDKEGKRMVVKNTYKKFPAQMLRARTISEGVRMTLPEVIVGIYTPEEVSDFEPARAVARTRQDEPAAIEATYTEAKEEPTPDAPAQARTWLKWAEYAEERVTWLNDRISAITDGRVLTSEQTKALTINVHRLSMAVAANAVKAGALDEPPKQNSVWALRAVQAVIEQGEDWELWVRTEVRDYTAAKLKRAKEAVAIQNAPRELPPQAARPAPAELETAGATREREPGEDD